MLNSVRFSFLKKIIFLISLIFLVIQPVRGEARVKITASKDGHYDLEKQIFTGSGDVEITYGDLILRGDLFYIDLVSTEILLEGSVELIQDGQELRGESLSFNLETGEGQLDNAKTEIVLPQGTGSIYLSGESLGLLADNYKIINAQFTTCDLPGSHYHLATKELEIVVGEKVIIRGVTYYEGKLPIFYWPYIVIPLDSEGGRFTLPVFGYSEQEGYYMKNTFNYYFNPRSYGNIYLDFFTRLGVGIGARHNYNLEKLGKGSLYLYGIPVQKDVDQSILKAAWDHELVGEGWKLTTNTAYEDSWLRQELSSQNRFTLTYPKYNGELWYNYKSNPQLSIKRSLDYGGRWSQDLSNTFSINLKANQIEQKRLETQRVLSYLAEGVYRQGKQTVTLAVEQQYNPDLLKETPARWMTVQRIPELTWDMADLGLEKITLSSQVILGRYEEHGPGLVKGGRVLAELRLRPKTHPLARGMSLTYQGDLGRSFYNGGQSQTWLHGRVSYNHRLGQNLRFSGTYTQREVWGTTPFLFDRENPQQDLRLNLNYTEPKWSLGLNSGYNFRTKRFNPLVFQARVRPSEQWNLSLFGDYDLNTKGLNRLVPMVEYGVGDLDLKLAGRYQVKRGEWSQLDAKISLPLGETWQVSYDSIYKPPQGTFSRGLISVTKDLHCREISGSYDHVNGRIALQYTINAFPTLPIGWDSAEGLGLFDFDDVSDIIGGLD